jgi:hypothetical protein
MADNKYDLVGTHIDFIRRKIKEVSDDSYFQDEEIYKALIDARALVIERKLEKGKQYPEYMYQTICMLLCLDKYSDCNCVPAEYDCTVLKTINEIPTAFYNGYTTLVRITTLSGEEISENTEQQARLRKYRKTRKDNLYYILTNKRASIFNSPQNRLKVVKLRGLFVDPAGAAMAAGCPDGGPHCVDVLGTGFSTKPSDNIDIYDIAIKGLLMVKQLPEDVSNDAESVLDQTEY